MKHLLVIEEDLNLASFRDDSEGMPLSNLNRMIEVLKKVPDSLDDSVDANILLQRIGPRQVVVAVISSSPDQATPI